MKFEKRDNSANQNSSLPSRERGLKCLTAVRRLDNHDVAPFTGAWIEIGIPIPDAYLGMSLPSRERGLKYVLFVGKERFILVAPFTGAWIEIQSSKLKSNMAIVAPFTGAWIEILIACILSF